MKRYFFWLVSLILCMGFISVPAAFGQPYYKGKTLTFIIPHNPGGGTDTFGRVLARHLPRHIPGNPTIIVRNMPGGAGMLGPNYVAKAAKKDGLTALVGSSYVAAHDMVKTKGVKFDYSEMPIALVCPSGEVYVTRPEKCPKPEDIVKVGHTLIFGYGPMPIGQTLCFMLCKELFGFDTKKDVLAFSGSSDSRRAYLAGEIDIYTGSFISYSAGDLPYVRKGEMVPLWQSGLYDTQGVLRRQPGVGANIPTIEEVYENIYGKKPSGRYWEAISAYIYYARTLNKPLAFTPGTEKYAAIVREAALTLAKDPKFLKDYNKINPGAPLYVGKDARRIMDLAAKKVRHVRPWLQNWINEGWGITFEK